jgi:uncharacterized protein
MRLVVIALVLATSTALAADKAAKPTPKDSDIRKLMVMSGAGEMGAQVAKQLLQTFKTSAPGVPPAFWDEMDKEIKPEDLITLIAPVYDRHFSHDEVKQLIAFYESPIGKKLVKEQPAIASESMAAGQEWGMAVAGKIQKRMQERGYLKAQ